MQSNIKFKIRCSAIGNIMTEPRAKKDKEAGILSKTVQSYCKDWLKEQLFNRKKEFTNKYTEKGTSAEDESINFLVENDILDFAVKNEERKENDFMSGECDILVPGRVIDVKNSWDLFTFPLFEDQNENKAYWWQLQGYMELYDVKNASLIYILSNTPDYIVDKEIYYKTNDIEYLSKSDYEAIENEIRYNHNYSDINYKLKYKRFDFNYNADAIKKIKSRVVQCQKYIDGLMAKYI